MTDDEPAIGLSSLASVEMMMTVAANCLAVPACLKVDKSGILRGLQSEIDTGRFRYCIMPVG